MLLTEKCLDFISDHLEVENNPITFKFLSRELDFSVSQSKNILLEYYDKFKSSKKFNLHYCITGTSKNGNILIKITNMTELRKSKEEFKTIRSCDIFSIELNSNLSLSNIVSINETTKKPYNELNMTKWGLIQTHTSINLANEPEMKESKPTIRIKTEPVKLETETKKEIKAKKEPESANRPAYVSRKASTIPPSKSDKKLDKKSEQPITSLYKSRKNLPKRKSEVIIDNIQDDFDDGDGDGDDDYLATSAMKRTKVETQEQRRKREENLKMLDAMFDDDDFRDDDAKEEKETEKLQNNDIDIDVDIGEQPYTDAKINDTNSNEGDAEMVEFSDENAREINEEPKPIDKFVHKQTENEKVADLKQAKEEPVVETFIDDDGYVVRKVNKKVAPSKSKSGSSSKPSIKNFTIDTKKDNKLNKKQASLMSFFKKK